jgi:glucose-fructose oxidoreductase
VYCEFSKSTDRKFREVPEMASAILRFPGGRTATFTCGFGSASISTFQLVGTRGELRLDSAYHFNSPLRRYLTVDGRTEIREFPKTDHFAPELMHFADCIKHDRNPAPSGMEGLADVRVVEACTQSANVEHPVLVAMGVVRRRHA